MPAPPGGTDGRQQQRIGHTPGSRGERALAPTSAPPGSIVRPGLNSQATTGSSSRSLSRLLQDQTHRERHESDAAEGHKGPSSAPSGLEPGQTLPGRTSSAPAPGEPLEGGLDLVRAGPGSAVVPPAHVPSGAPPAPL